MIDWLLQLEILKDSGVLRSQLKYSQIPWNMRALQHSYSVVRHIPLYIDLWCCSTLISDVVPHRCRPRNRGVPSIKNLVFSWILIQLISFLLWNVIHCFSFCSLWKIHQPLSAFGFLFCMTRWASFISVFIILFFNVQYNRMLIC